MRVNKLPDIDLSKVQTPAEYYQQQRERDEEIYQDFQGWVRHELRRSLGNERYWED